MVQVLLVAEGPSDVRRVRLIVNAWLAQNVGWFDEAHPEHTLRWVGLSGVEDWLDLHQVPSRFREAGFPPMFGQPFGKGEQANLKKLHLLLKRRGSPLPDVIVWTRDIDTQPQRETDTRAFVAGLGGAAKARYLLAFARQCGESWVLAGWHPRTPEQQDATRVVQRATNKVIPRDAHLVPHPHEHGGAEWCVCALGLDDPDAERVALLRGPGLSDDKTGLAEFCAALDQHEALRSALGLPPA